MRLIRLSIHGVTCYLHPQTVDLRDLGKLVALTGPNGAGKSTLLEVVPGSLYKRLPSRPGSLYESCHGRDSYMECAFEEGGREIVVRVQIDADLRKSEQFIFENGVPLTTGRHREHTETIERLFGSEALFMSSAFNCQSKAGSFLFIPKVERKALLIEMLGLAHLETLAQAARARGGAGEIRLAELRGALQAVQGKAGELDDAREVLAAAEDTCTLAQLAVGQAEANEVAARAANQEATVKAESAKALERQHAEALKRLDAARARTARARADYDRAKKDLERRVAIERQQIAGCKTILAKEPEVAAARGRLKQLEDEETALRLVDIEFSDAKADMVKAESEHERANHAHLASGRELSDLQRRAGLQAPCRAAESWTAEVGSGSMTQRLAEACPLLADTRAAAERLQEELIDQHDHNKVAAETANVARLKAVAEFNSAKKKRDGLRLHNEIAAERNQLETLANKDLDSQRKWMAQAEADLAGVEHELRVLSEAAMNEAHGVELEAQGEADRLGDAYTAAAGAVRNLQRTQDELHAAEKATKNCRESQREAERIRASSEANVDVLEKLVSKTGALQQETADVETQVGDWNLLAQALGKDGVQALEIDAAGPEIARICNELLEACYGPRFSLSFETLREKKSKPGEFSESFDVRVLDRGQERTVEALSGGERVIVGEALGLSISVLNSRKNRVQHATLYRDETCGALDPANAQAYLDLLRKALDLGGFSQCIFIAHQPEIWQRADSRLFVNKGAVEVG